MSERRVVCARLTEKEIAMLGKFGKNMTDGLRRLIHGAELPSSPPMPTIGEALALGATVTFKDASGTFPVVRFGDAPPPKPSLSQTFPPLATETSCDLRHLSFRETA